MKNIYLLFALAFIFSTSATARTYVSTSSGNWNSAATWTPAGGPPTANDTIIVNHAVTLNVSITINDLLRVNGGGSLISTNRTIQINATAQLLINNGTVDVKAITNNGLITNTNGTLTVQGNLDNNGTIVNNGLVTVNGNLINTGGTLTGNTGNYIIDINAINNAGGQITGTINICRPDGVTSPIVNGSGTVSGTITVCGVLLPVTYTEIKAMQTDTKIVVNWATQNEKNAAYFVIEKSVDGIIYNAVAEIKACGNCAEEKYSYEDTKPVFGKNYYKIKQVDNDGTYTYTEIITCTYKGLKELRKDIFPNPATGEIVTLNLITPEEENDNIYLSVISGNGSEVYTESYTSPNHVYYVEINIHEKQLSPGVYFISAIGNDVLFREKIVVY